MARSPDAPRIVDFLRPQKKLALTDGRVEVSLRVNCACQHHDELLGFACVLTIRWRFVAESLCRLEFTIEDSQQTTIARGKTQPIKVTNQHKKRDTHVRQSTPLAPGNGALTEQVTLYPIHGSDRGVTPSSIPVPHSVGESSNSQDFAAIYEPPRGNDLLQCYTPGQSGEGSGSGPPTWFMPEDDTISHHLPVSLAPPNPQQQQPTPRIVPGGDIIRDTMAAIDGSMCVASGNGALHQQVTSYPLHDPDCGASPVSIPLPHSLAEPSIVQETAQVCGPSYVNDLLQGHPEQLDMSSGSIGSAFFHPRNASHPAPPQQSPTTHIEEITPDEGDVMGGTKVLITGTGFPPNFQFYFGHCPARDTKMWSDTAYKCYSPCRGTPGSVQVRFDGMPEAQPAPLFTYLDTRKEKL